MSFCIHCGGQISDEAGFCPNCGKSVSGASGGTAVVAVHKTESEKTFFSTEGITVTNSRVILPRQTYAMAGITSVRSTVIDAKRGWPIFIAIVGLLLLLTRAYGWGIALMLAGIAWAIGLKDRHAVTLSSASGQTHAVISKDAAFVSQIVQAINEAIVYRN